MYKALITDKELHASVSTRRFCIPLCIEGISKKEAVDTSVSKHPVISGKVVRQGRITLLSVQVGVLGQCLSARVSSMHQILDKKVGVTEVGFFAVVPERIN